MSRIYQFPFVDQKNLTKYKTNKPTFEKFDQTLSTKNEQFEFEMNTMSLSKIVNNDLVE